MKGLPAILRAFGVNVTSEHIKAVEEIIPQIPARLSQAANVINSAIANFDARLRNIEQQNAKIIELLELQNGTRKPGDTAN